MIEINAKLKETALDQVQEIMERVLDNTAELTMQAALEEARASLNGGQGPQSRSGALESSLDYALEGGGGQAQGWLRSSSIYAPVHEYGAIIQARQAAYLKFQVQGQWAQVRSVTIPARPFLAPALELAGQEMEDFLAQALAQE